MARKQMTREEGVALSGENMAKEAKALRLVRQLAKADGRFYLTKSFETAVADFCMFLPGHDNEAIGVQLKTSHIDDTKRNFQFAHTLGYEGLLMMLVGFRGDDVRVWLMPGTSVTNDSIQIPAEIKRKTRTPWRDYETPLSDVSQRLLNLLTSPAVYDIKSADEWHKPTEKTRLYEYEAFMLLKSQLPVEYVEPDVEHLAYDWIVDGFTWQMKVATFDKDVDSFHVSVHKMHGKQNGHQTRSQYEDGDFDYLCLQLPHGDARPPNVPPRAYLVPMDVLLKRGIAGKDVWGGSVRLYPHRESHCRTDWVEAYAIDLGSPSAALASYHNIMQGVKYADTNDYPLGITAIRKDGVTVGFKAACRGDTRTVIARGLSIRQKLQECEEWMRAARAGDTLPPVSGRTPARRNQANTDLPSHIYLTTTGKFRVYIAGHADKRFATLDEAIKQKKVLLEEREVKSVLNDIVAAVAMDT